MLLNLKMPEDGAAVAAIAHERASAIKGISRSLHPRIVVAGDTKGVVAGDQGQES